MWTEGATVHLGNAELDERVFESQLSFATVEELERWLAEQSERALFDLRLGIRRATLLRQTA